MPRNKKPLNILEFEGRSHRTKKEKEERRNSEIKLGCALIPIPARVKKNPAARAKWRELMKIFDSPQGKDLVTSADSDILAQYCLLWGDYCYLRDQNDADLIPEMRRCSESLTKLQNNLFLNPLARIKNVLKTKEKEEKNPLEKLGFGNVI